MRKIVLSSLAAGAISVMVAFPSAAALAKTAAECSADYAANKAAIKESGRNKKAYVAACVAGTADLPEGATPVAAPTAASTAGGKTAAQCNVEYATNKAAFKASGQTKRDFVAACRGRTEGIATTLAASGLATTPPPAVGPVGPKPHVGAIGAVEFATDTAAQAHCPTDTVVWVNTNFNIYHFAGYYAYGNTRAGAYMCEADAKVAGDIPGFNEKHP